jgi:hypothetical protein
MCLSPTRYQHQIICLNGSNPQSGKYQLQISEINSNGRLLQRARWNFRTFKGLMVFLQRHFPESELLHQEISQCIQFQVVKALNDWNSLEGSVGSAPDMSRQVHPDHEAWSTLPGLVPASCG